ncbi:MAG: hypothetical protein GXO35_01480 [Gammaproteobacteria bacterium]|nr:hypothetical protein [Gammaproteobacteria bacterium]
MDNKITVVMDFSYVGEEHHFEAEIKLPPHLGGLSEFAHSIPRVIGRQNKVDSYSYMYEVMDCTPVQVVAAEGYVAKFLEAGAMPLHDFLAACSEVTTERLMQHIAETYLAKGCDQDQVHQALMAAFQIGFSAGEES